MNKLLEYLMGRMGKRTCPIISLHRVYSPWKDWIEIKLKDGTIIKLMKKPK